jgi:predicted kinase
MRVILLTGTCGSGKSTIASHLGARPGWARLSEDEIWAAEFGLDRGAFGSSEHREKRRHVQGVAFQRLDQHLAAQTSVAIDVTLHESPPEAFEAYRVHLEARRVSWAIRVLHPSLDVAVARDAARSSKPLGRERIAALRDKFSGRTFPSEWFIDSSTDSVEHTVQRLIREGVA